MYWKLKQTLKQQVESKISQSPDRHQEKCVFKFWKFLMIRSPEYAAKNHATELLILGLSGEYSTKFQHNGIAFETAEMPSLWNWITRSAPTNSCCDCGSTGDNWNKLAAKLALCHCEPSEPQLHLNAAARSSLDRALISYKALPAKNRTVFSPSRSPDDILISRPSRLIYQGRPTNSISDRSPTPTRPNSHHHSQIDSKKLLTLQLWSS